jgi:hypothetical protein
MRRNEPNEGGGNNGATCMRLAPTGFNIEEVRSEHAGRRLSCGMAVGCQRVVNERRQGCKAVAGWRRRKIQETVYG